jgi:hypothetical protein
MEIFLIVAQFTLALSVAFVWIFRYDNVVKEFKQFGLSDLTRNFVGASKIALATLLIAGVWHPALVLISSLLMGFFMVVAQFFHFKIKNHYLKHLPSLILLILAITIAIGSIQST